MCRERVILNSSTNPVRLFPGWRSFYGISELNFFLCDMYGNFDVRSVCMS